MAGRGVAMVTPHWQRATGVVQGGFYGYRADSTCSPQIAIARGGNPISVVESMADHAALGFAMTRAGTDAQPWCGGANPAATHGRGDDPWVVADPWGSTSVNQPQQQQQQQQPQEAVRPLATVVADTWSSSTPHQLQLQGSIQREVTRPLASPSADLQKTLQQQCTYAEPTLPKSEVGATVRGVSASPTHDEYFTVDIGRSCSEQRVGCKLKPHDKGLLVEQVFPESIIADWNERCRRWFPRDELCFGDVVLKVNDVGIMPPGGPQIMLEELKSTKDLLLLVLRQTSSNESEDV